MKISELLSLKLITLDLTSTDKTSLFGELIDMMISAGLPVERDVAMQAVVKRENIMSTGISHLLAVPHGRLENLEHSMVGIGISKSGIEYGALDHEPIRVAVMVFSPKKNPLEHIQVLSDVFRVFSNVSVINELCMAKTANDVLATIKEVEKEQALA